MRRLSYVDKGVDDSRRPSRTSKISKTMKKWGKRIMGPLAAGLMLLPATCLAKNAANSQKTAVTQKANNNNKINGMKKILLAAILQVEKKGRKYIVRSLTNSTGSAFEVPFKTSPVTVKGLVKLYYKGSKGPDNKILSEDKVYAVVAIHNTKNQSTKSYLIDLSHLPRAYLKLMGKRMKRLNIAINHEINRRKGYEEVEIIVIPGKIKVGIPTTAFGYITTNKRPSYSSESHVVASR